MRKAIVMGAGGFIGGHLVEKLKSEDFYVVGADIKFPEFRETLADEFVQCDLSSREEMFNLLENHKDAVEIYQLAADMGGAGYIFTGENDLLVMENSASINLALTWFLTQSKHAGEWKPKIFYSSSACIYPDSIQQDPHSVDLREEYAYPANPDSEYGWEKLFSERLFLALERNFGIPVRVARFHNVYGPFGTWTGGREKAPAALCRKVAMASSESPTVEIWGPGTQTRSFLYVSDCVEAIRRFMAQDQFSGPLNIGSEEKVSLNEMASMIGEISNKDITIKNVTGPIGVMGRNSNNDLVRETLDWDYKFSLRAGLEQTYRWIEQQVRQADDVKI
jgi:GDP-D-mannose 3', 5'-epimerase